MPSSSDLCRRRLSTVLRVQNQEVAIDVETLLKLLSLDSSWGCVHTTQDWSSTGYAGEDQLFQLFFEDKISHLRFKFQDVS